MIWVYEDCKINFWSSYAFSFSPFRARIVFRSAIQKTTKIHINSRKLWIIKFLCNSRAEACAFNAQTNAAQKINFAIKDFFSNQIRQETAYFVIFTEETLNLKIVQWKFALISEFKINSLHVPLELCKLQ